MAVRWTLTPTPNQCIVEVAYAVGLINDSRRESLLDALAGVRLMHAISVQKVDDFGVRRRRDGMAAKTVYTELTIVRQWLNFAVTRRMLTMNPVAGTKRVKPKPGPRDYWREEQLDLMRS